MESSSQMHQNSDSLAKRICLERHNVQSKAPGKRGYWMFKQPFFWERLADLIESNPNCGNHLALEKIKNQDPAWRPAIGCVIAAMQCKETKFGCDSVIDVYFKPKQVLNAEFTVFVGIFRNKACNHIPNKDISKQRSNCNNLCENIAPRLAPLVQLENSTNIASLADFANHNQNNVKTAQYANRKSERYDANISISIMKKIAEERTCYKGGKKLHDFMKGNLRHFTHNGGPSVNVANHHC